MTEDATSPPGPEAPPGADLAESIPPDPEPSRTRWAFYAGGTAMAGWGLLGLLTATRSNPVAWLRFATTVVIANDGLLAPLVILTGVLVRRLLPPAHRGLIQVGLLITGTVTLVALPALLGYGRTTDNPSALPLDYGQGLLVVVACVWTVLGALALLGRARRARHGGPADPPGEPAPDADPDPYSDCL